MPTNNNSNELDIQAYRKFLFSHFPSHFLKDKINAATAVANSTAEQTPGEKKHGHKRRAPFTESSNPSKKQKVSPTVGGGADIDANNKMYCKYSNIITTRSGKKIKIPNKQWQQMQTMLKNSGKNEVVAAKSPKAIPPHMTANSSGSRGGGVLGAQSQSKIASAKKMSTAQNVSKGDRSKSLKKAFHQPPPESSTDDDGNGECDGDGDGDEGTELEDSVSSSNASGSGRELSSCARERKSGSFISAFRKKQAASHLKKLLSKKMNIIITMNRPSAGNGKTKSKSKSNASREVYEEEDGDDVYPDEEFEDDDDDDENTATGDEDSGSNSDDYDDDDEDEDDNEDDDDEDDDDEDDDDEDDDEDDDDSDDDDYEDDDGDETMPSLSRNVSSNSLFSAPSNSTPKSERSFAFANDADFMKFVQRSPLTLLNGKGKTEKDEQTLDMLFSNIRDMYKSDPDNQVLRAYYYQLKNACKQIKEDRAKRMLKEKKQNCKEFKKLLKKRNSTNDLRYFKKHFTPEKQAQLIEEIKEVNKISYSEIPYRLSVLQAPIPRLFKSIALNKISTLRNMDSGSGEFYKIKNWVDGFMKIPFDNEKLLPVTLETHGREACSAFMDRAKKQLDDAVYGLDDAKLQLMQLVGQWISNPQAMGTAVAIHGPPGTGKTSLIKDGVSQILGRDFAFIALGGATDSSFLEGHSFTYEGSTWGKIVDILIQCKSTNPVIYFDELDKISDTPKGDEIVGILTHLTDTSQNSQFHDKYFSEIAFDLSKCLFIFSYNDESRVNRVLLDRMYRIRTSGYSAKEKICITQNYLVPKIVDQVKFSLQDVVISSEVIEYIVENYTEKEEGVRNLKRCLEIIHTKLNLYRLMTPGTIVSMFPKEFKSTEVKFPFAVTRDNLEHLLKKNEVRLSHGMYL